MKNWISKEKKDAKDFDGRRNKGSGNQWFRPGDLSIPGHNLLIECKQTDKKSYSISIETLEKLYSEALFSYKIPILSIQIKDIEVVLMFKEDFKKIILKNLK
mgnify:CR=1 FL=1